MQNIDLCTRETIELSLRDGSIKKTPGWRFHELAAHIMTKGDFWGITHLPSGCNFGFLFLCVEDAVNAMIELSALRNSWEFIAMEDFKALAPQGIPILYKNNGVPAHYIYNVEFAPANFNKRANGYDSL